MDSSLPDYYATLNISPTSTTSEIKEAYKRQSLSCHPDRFPNASPSARKSYTSRFQSVADAYYVLSDSERRSDYDEARKSSQNMPGGNWFGPDGDPEKEQFSSASFFNSFFGGAGAGKGADSSSGAREGSAQPEREYAVEMRRSREESRTSCAALEVVGHSSIIILDPNMKFDLMLLQISCGWIHPGERRRRESHSFYVFQSFD